MSHNDGISPISIEDADVGEFGASCFDCPSVPVNVGFPHLWRQMWSLGGHEQRDWWLNAKNRTPY